MILAEKAGDVIQVTLPPTYIEYMKRIPGSRYVQGVWSVPLAWSACLQLRREFGELLDIGPELWDWGHELVESRNRLMQLRQGQYVFDDCSWFPVEPASHLYDFQQQAVRWMFGAKRCLLGSEPRTGKTLVTIETLVQLGPEALPALVVGPNTMKYTWADEVHKWSGLQASVLHGSKAQKEKALKVGADVFVTNWETIRTLSRLAPYGSLALSDKEKTLGPLNEMGFRTVILDEAHRMADPKAKQTRAAWWLAWQADYRFALTGTPIRDHPGDLFSVMHALAPEEYPVRSTWLDRYAICGQGRFGFEIWGLRPEYMQEFYEIFDPRFLRHTKAQVRPDRKEQLPPQIRYVEMGTQQKKAYNDFDKSLLVEIDGEIMAESTALVVAARKTQLAAATPVLEDNKVLSLKMPSNKVDAFFELWDEEATPTVVFSPSRLLIELLERECEKKKLPVVLITGEVDPQMRAANVARFQAGVVDVALCTTGAASEGITLSRAERVIFLGLPTSLIQWKQSKERGEDINQDPCDIVVVLSENTIDTNCLPILDGKEIRLQEIVRDG